MNKPLAKQNFQQILGAFEHKVLIKSILKSTYYNFIMWGIILGLS